MKNVIQQHGPEVHVHSNQFTYGPLTGEGFRIIFGEHHCTLCRLYLFGVGLPGFWHLPDWLRSKVWPDLSLSGD